jgi:hypothetical protein
MLVISFTAAATAFVAIATRCKVTNFIVVVGVDWRGEHHAFAILAHASRSAILARMCIGATRRLDLARHANLANAVVQILAFAFEALEATAHVMANLGRRHCARTSLAATRARVLRIACVLIRAQRIGTTPMPIRAVTFGCRRSIGAERFVAATISNAATACDGGTCFIVAFAAGAIPDAAQELATLTIVDNFTEMFVLIEDARHATCALSFHPRRRWRRVPRGTTRSHTLKRVATTKLFANSCIGHL